MSRHTAADRERIEEDLIARIRTDRSHEERVLRTDSGEPGQAVTVRLTGHGSSGDRLTFLCAGGGTLTVIVRPEPARPAPAFAQRCDSTLISVVSPGRRTVVITPSADQARVAWAVTRDSTR